MYFLPISYHQCKHNQSKKTKKGTSKYQPHDYTQLLLLLSLNGFMKWKLTIYTGKLNMFPVCCPLRNVKETYTV